ncbi:AraC family transcriptional regulator [Chryseobacterium sp. C39-AII1]|uniref:helix-turn-helix domain-containing protein n=1 Tax=Chryseobacterium sp. C39-AII1 TaxID=3080332 RepID=UPI00320A7506
MPKITTNLVEALIKIDEVELHELTIASQFSMYTVILLTSGEGCFQADFGKFSFKAPALLFATPLQTIYLQEICKLEGKILQFHGDFYCIEFHRKEVACNGLLFNNIYIDPVVSLNDDELRSLAIIYEEFLNEFRNSDPSEIVIRALLQLFLAKSSSIKIRTIENRAGNSAHDLLMERFVELLNEHYLEHRKPSDYARLLSLTTNNFSKRCIRYFKKTPSQLITERMILEAKKQLHLTRLSIKEIAYNLKFEDESYFSRIFKKYTNVSPQTFRNKTGISIVADLHQY